MTNTKNSNNNPEKELTPEKQNISEKDKEISKKNSPQTKTVGPNNKKSNKSIDDLSIEIFSELISRKNLLVKEIKDLETKKNELNKDIESNFDGQSENIAKRVKGFQEYLKGALQNLSQNV